MNLVQEQQLFLLDAVRLIAYATKLGFCVTGGELYRTTEQQEIYVKSGRSKTMNSNHLKRCAIDLNFFKYGKLVYDKATLQRERVVQSLQLADLPDLPARLAAVRTSADATLQHDIDDLLGRVARAHATR